MVIQDSCENVSDNAAFIIMYLANIISLKDLPTISENYKLDIAFFYLIDRISHKSWIFNEEKHCSNNVPSYYTKIIRDFLQFDRSVVIKEELRNRIDDLNEALLSIHDNKFVARITLPQTKNKKVLTTFVRVQHNSNILVNA